MNDKYSKFWKDLAFTHAPYFLSLCIIKKSRKFRKTLPTTILQRR